VNQFDHNLAALIKDIPIIISDVVLEVAQDAKAMIQQRVQEKGLNASGGKTPEYSESYALYRKKRGRQTDHMDLTLTGSMWQSIGVVEKQQTPDETKMTVAGRDEFTQLKIDVHSRNQFEVLKLAKDEEEFLQPRIDELLTGKLIEYLERGIS
jgi:hypothetical protein